MKASIKKKGNKVKIVPCVLEERDSSNTIKRVLARTSSEMIILKDYHYFWVDIYPDKSCEIDIGAEVEITSVAYRGNSHAYVKYTITKTSSQIKKEMDVFATKYQRNTSRFQDIINDLYNCSSLSELLKQIDQIDVEEFADLIGYNASINRRIGKDRLKKLINKAKKLRDESIQDLVDGLYSLMNHQGGKPTQAMRKIISFEIK